MESQGSGSREQPAAPPSEGFGMFVLKLWMWAVPIVMMAASVVFGAIAAVDGRWGLLAVMVVMGLMAVSLFMFHWWVMYRFGKISRIC